MNDRYIRYSVGATIDKRYSAIYSALSTKGCTSEHLLFTIKNDRPTITTNKKRMKIHNNKISASKINTA